MGRSEVVLSVMETSGMSEAGFSVFSVVPVMSPISVLVFPIVSVFSVFIGENSEVKAGKSTMRGHDKGHERAR